MLTCGAIIQIFENATKHFEFSQNTGREDVLATFNRMIGNTLIILDVVKTGRPTKTRVATGVIRYTINSNCMKYPSQARKYFDNNLVVGPAVRRE